MIVKKWLIIWWMNMLACFGLWGCLHQPENENIQQDGVSDSLNPRGTAAGLYKLAMMHYRVADFHHALLLMDSAMVVAGQSGDHLTEANSLNMLGFFYIESGDTANAIQLLEKSFRLAETHVYYKQAGVALTNLALTEAGRPGYTDKLRQALEWFEKTGKNCPETGMVYNNLGNHTSNPDTALFYLRKAAEIGEMIPDHEVAVLAYNNMAYSYLEKMQRSKAASCLLDKAIPLAEKYNDHKMLANLYDTYADVLLDGGEGVLAAKYMKKSLEASQAAAAKEASAQTRLLLALLDVKNKEITIRKHETMLMVKDEHIQRLWVLTTILALLAISALLTMRLFRLKEKVRVKEKEKEHTRQLLRLENSEKQRVAMQLHDLIGPVKNMILQQLGEVEKTDSTVIASMKTQLTNLAASLRTLSHRMNQAMLEQLTLSETLDTLRHDFAGISDARIDFFMDPVCRQVRGEITGQLFFILLELLTNAMKYAPGSAIEISISAEFDHLYLICRDHGPGFDRDLNQEKGMGLSNIRARAAIFGGTAHLETSVGKGTVWTISIPCKFADHDPEKNENG